MKYIRIFRFPDQYPYGVAVLAAAIYLGIREWWVFVWMLSSVLISASAGFVLNEVVDGSDVDRGSWNTMHVARSEKFDPIILWSLFSAVLMLGLWLAFQVGLFWWGVAIAVLGVFYSVKPIRWKAVLGIDIMTQLASMFWIPLLAPFWRVGIYSLPSLTVFALVLSLFMFAGFFLYQLADYRQDVKAGLRSTHVVLGVDKSIYLGAAAGLIAILGFFLFRLWDIARWSVAFIPVGLYTLHRYYMAARIKELNRRIALFVSYVRIMKPISMLFVPFLFVWWLVS